MSDEFISKSSTCSACPLIKTPMLMSLMILYAVSLHILWGISIIFEPSASKITATAFLSEMFNSNLLIGTIYIIIGILASFSLFGRPKKWKLIMALFQQALLIQSSFSALKCMIYGQFPDGVVRPTLFILADQSSIILAMILHSVALIRMGTRIFSTSLLKRVNDITHYDNS